MLQPWTCHCGQTNVGPAPCSACLNAAPPGIGGVAPPAARRGPGTAVMALALVTAVLLVGGLVSAVLVATHEDQPAAVPRAAEARSAEARTVEARTVEVSPTSEPAADASELERALPALMRFVQETRGLPFTTPVEVTLLPDKAFRARLADQEGEDAAQAEEELKTTQRVLEGLGLLEKGIDLKAAVDSLYGDAVAGFYDTEKHDLVVRGEQLTVSVRTTLVHELTHALQDQHFDIDRKDFDDRDDEASTGLTGLVEGDAVRVERLYLASLTRAEQKQGEREEGAAGAGIDPALPRVLLQLVAFPYIYGPDFATAVVEGGGQSRLDEAFGEPPTTSEQLLHPEVFLEGQPVQVARDPGRRRGGDRPRRARRARPAARAERQRPERHAGGGRLGRRPLRRVAEGRRHLRAGAGGHGQPPGRRRAAWRPRRPGRAAQGTDRDRTGPVHLHVVRLRGRFGWDSLACNPVPTRGRETRAGHRRSRHPVG